MKKVKDMKKYMSGQEAIDRGIITEGDWQQAITHPWVWVIISDALKVREIPWQGLEIDRTKIPTEEDAFDPILHDLTDSIQDVQWGH